jgi:glycerol-3-phosphate acyltransferase PlsY
LPAEGVFHKKTGGKTVADTTGRKLVVLVLLAVIGALAVLPGGCMSGETRALESENARCVL